MHRGCSGIALIGSGNARTAACSTSALSQGTHSIVAAYAGDAGNTGSAAVLCRRSSMPPARAMSRWPATAPSHPRPAPTAPPYPVSAVNNNERAGYELGQRRRLERCHRQRLSRHRAIVFNGSKTINRVVVYTVAGQLPGPVEPTDTMTFSLYGITAFTVQGRQGTKWVTLASVTRQQPGQAHRHLRALHHQSDPHPHHRRPRFLSPASPRSKLGEIEMR